MQWIAAGILCTLLAVSEASDSRFVACVTNDDFPFHKLDISEPHTLDIDRVQQYTGYLTVRPETHSFFGGTKTDRLFFWLFESRNDPKNDPVVLWLNGGPGCSSMQAVLFENGPATLDENMVLQRNPYSWNSNATMIYLDQPLNVGYSVGSDKVRDSSQAAEDVYSFLSLLFKQFPQYKSLPLHLAGESYAGRYIPVMAERIMRDSSRTFSVDSIMLGNGAVDAYSEYASYQPMLCGKGGYHEVIQPETCDKMSKDLPQCTSDLRSCLDYNQDSACRKAQFSCRSQMQFGKLNPYDIRIPCQKTNTGLCYAGLDRVQDFFDSSAVKTALGVDQDLSYKVCSNSFMQGFDHWDEYVPTKHNVTNLLEQGVRTLVYSGDKDIIVNWLGGQMWTRDLAWSGHTQFAASIDSPATWTLPENSQKAGTVAQTGPLTFIRVFDAGHMVPHDQPAAALDMVNR